jgi:hypothetical protein
MWLTARAAGQIFAYGSQCVYMVYTYNKNILNNRDKIMANRMPLTFPTNTTPFTSVLIIT